MTAADSPQSPLRRAAGIAGIAGVGALAYGALLGALWLGQEKLLFMPQPLPGDHRFRFGDDVHEAWVDVPGARLHALHLKLPNPRGVVYYLHGNAGNLDGWFVNVEFYRRAGFDLFMPDYRGYGKSSGRIASQAELEADVRAAWASIAPRYAGLKRVFLGRSLGSGLAAGMAAELQPELTVLISPYVSLRALARDHYPWVPGALLRYPLRTDEALPKIERPVLLIHGARDTLIAPWHSDALLPLARRGRLVRLPDAGHNDLQEFDLYFVALREALDA